MTPQPNFTFTPPNSLVAATHAPRRGQHSPQHTGPRESETALTAGRRYPFHPPFPPIAAFCSDTSPCTEGHRLQRRISSRGRLPPAGIAISATEARMAAITGGFSSRREIANSHSPQAAYGKRKSGGSWENSCALDLSRDLQPEERDLKIGGALRERECGIYLRRSGDELPS